MEATPPVTPLPKPQSAPLRPKKLASNKRKAPPEVPNDEEENPDGPDDSFVLDGKEEGGAV